MKYKVIYNMMDTFSYSYIKKEPCLCILQINCQVLHCHFNCASQALLNGDQQNINICSSCVNIDRDFNDVDVKTHEKDQELHEISYEGYHPHKEEWCDDSYPYKDSEKRESLDKTESILFHSDDDLKEIKYFGSLNNLRK